MLTPSIPMATHSVGMGIQSRDHIPAAVPGPVSNYQASNLPCSETADNILTPDVPASVWERRCGLTHTTLLFFLCPGVADKAPLLSGLL